MNASIFPRTRCAEHGLILDDSGRCTRCAREQSGRNSRSVLFRAGVIGIFVVLALVGYRVVSMIYAVFPSRSVTATATATTGARLIVYTTTSCPACRIAKGWMDKNDVAYEERRVDVDDGARKELTSLGKGMIVPTFVVDDEVLTGFDVQGVRLSAALRSHGLR